MVFLIRLQELYSSLRNVIDHGGRGWTPFILAQPLGIVHAKSSGVRLSLEETTLMISYADLVRGMVLMGEQHDWWDGHGVACFAEGMVSV